MHVLVCTCMRSTCPCVTSTCACLHMPVCACVRVCTMHDYGYVQCMTTYMCMCECEEGRSMMVCLVQDQWTPQCIVGAELPASLNSLNRPYVAHACHITRQYPSTARPCRPQGLAGSKEFGYVLLDQYQPCISSLTGSQASWWWAQ